MRQSNCSEKNAFPQKVCSKPCEQEIFFLALHILYRVIDRAQILQGIYLSYRLVAASSADTQPVANRNIM